MKQMKQMDAKPLEDLSIWSAYKGGRFNSNTLKELVGECIKMAVQKTSGQQKNSLKSYLNWENWERVRMGIITEGILLVRSQLWDKLSDGVSTLPISPAEYPTWDFLFKKTGFADYHRTNSNMSHLKPREIEFNKQSLETAVVKMQNANCLEREHIKNAILCETVLLVLSGKLDELEET